MTLRAFVIDEVCPSTKMSVIEAITANVSRIPNGGALPKWVSFTVLGLKGKVRSKIRRIKNADFLTALLEIKFRR